MRERLALAILGLAAVSGCMSPSPTATPTGSADPLPVSACPEINLLTSAGDRLQLTGRWRSRDGGTYYVRQSESCVWITGFSVDTGAPGGEGASAYTNAFFGHLATDFTVSGVWADMPWGRETGAGTVTWEVEFAQVEGTEGVTLTVIEASNQGTLTLVEPGDVDVTLSVRLQDGDECAMVTADDGQDYELIVAAPGWQLLGPTQLVGPSGERFRPPDPFEVGGEVALGTGDCGPGQIFIADRID